MKSNDLKPGNVIRINNELNIITKKEHVKPGKGPAYVQIKFKNVTTGSVNEKRLRTGEDVEYVTLDRRDFEYLYSDGSGAIFMDLETYDQMTISDDLIGDIMVYIKPNTQVVVLIFEGNPITVEAPKVVELEITDTTPQAKGATATNQLKEATCETGLQTRVPPFIEIGEVVKINTEDGSYISRA